VISQGFINLNEHLRTDSLGIKCRPAKSNLASFAQLLREKGGGRHAGILPVQPERLGKSLEKELKFDGA
jgi:hypothetical protein